MSQRDDFCGPRAIIQTMLFLIGGMVLAYAMAYVALCLPISRVTLMSSGVDDQVYVYDTSVQWIAAKVVDVNGVAHPSHVVSGGSGWSWNGYLGTGYDMWHVLNSDQPPGGPDRFVETDPVTSYNVMVNRNAGSKRTVPIRLETLMSSYVDTPTVQTNAFVFLIGVPFRYAWGTDLKPQATTPFWNRALAGPTPKNSGIFAPFEPFPRVFPARFILASLLYASVLFFVVRVVPRSIRRYRMIRGRCPSCDYDLLRNYSSGCSECGWHKEHDFKTPESESDPEISTGSA